MERLFLECAVRALLLVSVTATLLYIMRVKDAAAKHRVLTCVMALMLLLPVWATSGPKISLRLLPPLSSDTASELRVETGALPGSGRPAPRSSNWELSLASIYLLGFFIFALRLAVGTIHTRRLTRGAVLRDGVHTSPLCSSPVTAGFFRPTVVLPENWRQWRQSKLSAVLTHEEEHARRHDSLIQWFTLLNRAVFWFHPAAWWLERTLSGLAEEACDNAVLLRGHEPHEYAECLLELARSVSLSGARLKAVGMALPGGFLQQRLRKIMEIGPRPHISGRWMVCVAVACAIACTIVAAGTLDHAGPKIPATNQAASQLASQASTKFVLGDLKVEGDVPNRDKIREAVLRQWQGKEYNDVNELAAVVVMRGIRSYFQDRGYFKIVAHDPATQLMSVRDGKQQVLVTVAVVPGEVYRLGTLSFRSAGTDQALSIPAGTLREQFNLHQNDLFNVAEFRAGLERIKELYKTHQLPDASLEPQTEVDDAAHQINVVVQIEERLHKP